MTTLTELSSQESSSIESSSMEADFIDDSIESASSASTEITFGRWMYEMREKNGLTMKQCAQRAGIKWQVWQRFERDEPKRRDGSPPQPARDTVVKLADALQASRAQALRAAKYTVLDTEEDTHLLNIQSLYDALGPDDQDDLLQLALLKWQRKNPSLSPYSLTASASHPDLQSGDYLCLDLQTGKLLSAVAIQPNVSDEPTAPLMGLLLRFLTWQEDRIQNAQDITQDLGEMRELLAIDEAVADLAHGSVPVNSDTEAVAPMRLSRS